MELIKLETRNRMDTNKFIDDIYLNVYYNRQELDDFIRNNHLENGSEYNGLDEWLECVSYSQAWFIYTHLKHEKSEFIKFQ